MPELNQGPVEPPEPVWVPQEPVQDQPSAEQGSSPPPPLGPAADTAWTDQNVVAQPACTPAETASPWIALVCGVAFWGLVFSKMTFVLLVPFVLLPVAAIIFGVVGRRQARKGRTSRGWMATTGMLLGIIAVGALGLFFFALARATSGL